MKQLALLACFALSVRVGACSGHTVGNTEGPGTDSAGGSDLGDASADGGAAGGLDGGSRAGQGNGAGGSLGSTVDASGGRPPEPIAPGSRICEDVRECSGLECRTWAGSGVALCVLSCNDSGECGEGELCLTAAELEPACVQRCEWPSDCLSGFDCFDWYRSGEYACVPALWVRFLLSLG